MASVPKLPGIHKAHLPQVMTLGGSRYLRNHVVLHVSVGQQVQFRLRQYEH
ncbi:MAG: hypothetical protein JSR66_04030 [Proteobacteria bacterium]|nr:hypothetical protein [Pseudomonadota bacterium]